MKNLDQIRAANALNATKEKQYKGANDGEVVKKIPTMIRENGILGAAAFALENAGKTGHADVFDAVIEHLRSVKRIPDASMSLQEFIEHLSEQNATVLRAVTAETMAYLNYLRRFAGKKGGEQ